MSSPVDLSSTSHEAPKPFRNFVLLWATQSVSILGDFITIFALTTWLAVVKFPDADQRASLAFALTAITAGQAVIGISLTAILGAIVDRYDRRRLMMVSELLNGTLSASLALLALTGHLEIWSMLPIVWIGAAVSELHQLAFDASFINVVDEDQLPRASGMMSTSHSTVAIASAPISLAIIAFAKSNHPGFLGDLIRWIGADGGGGTALVFAVDALTFLVAFAGLLIVRIPPLAREEGEDGHEQGGSLLREAFSGAGWLWRRKPLVALLSLSMAGNIAGTAALVLLPIVVKNLEADFSVRGWSFERSLAIVMTTAGITGIAGGLFISAWGGFRRNRAYVVGVSMLLSSLAIASLGSASSVWIVAALWGLESFLGPISLAHSRAIWQVRTPGELQGRVFAIRVMAVGGIVPIVAIVAGWLASRFDAGSVVTGFGIASVAASTALLFSPLLREVERSVPVSDPAPGAL